MGKYITFQTNPSLIFMYQKLSENPWLIWPSLRLHPCSWRSLTISEAHLQLILPLRGANGRRGKLTVKRNLREFLYHTSKHGAHHEDMKACSMSHVQEYNLILWLSFCLAHWWIKQRIHNQLEHQILESDYDHYNCNRYQLDVTNPHVVSKHIRFLIGAVSEKVNTNLNSRKRCVKYIREHISAGRLNSTMMPGVPHRIASGNACAGQGMSLHRERDAIWLTIPLHQEPVIEQDFTTTSRSLTVTNMIQLLHLLFACPTSHWRGRLILQDTGKGQQPCAQIWAARCSRADLFPLLGPFHVLKVWRNDVFHRTQFLQSSPWSRGGNWIHPVQSGQTWPDGLPRPAKERERERSLYVMTHTQIYI